MINLLRIHNTVVTIENLSKNPESLFYVYVQIDVTGRMSDWTIAQLKLYL